MLARFLSSRDEQLRRSRSSAEGPTIPELYRDPEFLAGNQQYVRVLAAFPKGVVSRPSGEAGKRYPEVSRAYFEAVHAVLSHQKSASTAANDLEVKLRQVLAENANADVSQDASAVKR